MIIKERLQKVMETVQSIVKKMKETLTAIKTNILSIRKFQ